MNAYPTIMCSTASIQTSHGLEYTFLITSESGRQYRYEAVDFACDTRTHLELASETDCLHCPLCLQKLCRERSEWLGQVDGLGFMRLTSKEDVEAVLETLPDEKLHGMEPEKRLSAYISKAQLLELLGRGPEMLDAALKAYAFERNASTAYLLAGACFVNGQLVQSCDYYREAYSLPHSDRGRETQIDIDYAISLRSLDRDSHKWKENWGIVKQKSWKTTERLGIAQWNGGPTEHLHLILEDGLGDVLCTLRYLDQIRSRGVQRISAWAYDIPKYSDDFIDFLNSQEWMPRIRRLPSDPEEFQAWRNSVRACIGTGEIEPALGIELKDVPPPACFKAPAESIKKYEYLKKNRRKPLFGIVWAAGQLELNWSDDGSYRTLKTQQISDIIQKSGDIDWISVQFKRKSPVSGLIVPETNSWSDTAGLLANLDGLVTVDTSVMHLGNAMRVPTFVLASGATNWRLVRGEQFYPGAKVFQNFAFGFDNSVRDLIAHLQQHIS